MTIIKQILESVSLSKPNHDFLQKLITVLYARIGRANFTNLARFSPFCQKTFMRHFRKQLPFDLLHKHLIQRFISNSSQRKTYIASIDASFIQKNGKQTFGLAQFHNGVIGAAQKRLEVSLIAVTKVESKNTFTLSVRQTPDQETIFQELENTSSSSSPVTRMDWHAAQIQNTEFPTSV